MSKFRSPLARLRKTYRDNFNRKRFKRQAIYSMGGCCQICSYDRHVGALEFHHINPDEKEFHFNNVRLMNEKVKKELQSCILLCANCHREVHAGIVCIPETYATFDEKLCEEFVPDPIAYPEELCYKKE